MPCRWWCHSFWQPRGRRFSAASLRSLAPLCTGAAGMGQTLWSNAAPPGEPVKQHNSIANAQRSIPKSNNRSADLIYPNIMWYVWQIDTVTWLSPWCLFLMFMIHVFFRKKKKPNKHTSRVFAALQTTQHLKLHNCRMLGCVGLFFGPFWWIISGHHESNARRMYFQPQFWKQKYKQKTDEVLRKQIFVTCQTPSQCVSVHNSTNAH